MWPLMVPLSSWVRMSVSASARSCWGTAKLIRNAPERVPSAGYVVRGMCAKYLCGNEKRRAGSRAMSSLTAPRYRATPANDPEARGPLRWDAQDT